MKAIPYGLHSLDEEDVRAVVEVLKGNWITTGPKVDEFEKRLSDYVGAKHSIAVNSGTSALDIAVASLELPEGSEIITTPFTFVASSNCILYNGCRPVFADINPKTYNIDPEKIKEKITEKTKAILYVDYAGQPCDIASIKEIAEEKGLYLIEDASHALGAEYRGKKIGTFADITVFSFHPVKPITTGEGGATVTDNKEFAKRMRMLRNHGIDKTHSERATYHYDMKLLGRNYRLTDLQCALGISQLGKLDSFIKRRNEIADAYNSELKDTEGIAVPYVSKDVKHGWHLYTILLDKKISRDGFFKQMKEKNIGVNVHYIPIYHFAYYSRFSIDRNDFPVTEDIYSRIVTLPLFPKMNGDEVNSVARAVKETIGEML